MTTKKPEKLQQIDLKQLDKVTGGEHGDPPKTIADPRYGGVRFG